MTRRAPNFGVGSEGDVGHHGPTSPRRKNPTKRVVIDGVTYEIKPLTGPLRAVAAYRRIVSVMPPPDWTKGSNNEP